ncbi:crossover junction endonuclease MUS81 [Diaporthe helianthi]|uniref:Crossover junction endonuclease MUS81 n=1 Tax=Diaporthe helianthi TaxID=158607 RepID=A0A2P5I3V7_DIAHE|nr:crossover junction endonuclease MUS81 [Diaporthe helianthi]
MPSDEDSPNALLLSWVKEWYDDAREKNTKGVNTYRKAYNSLKKCPKVFQHPSELTELQFFGQTLTRRLTEKLEFYCRENGLPMPDRPSKSRKRKGPGTGDGDEHSNEDEEVPAPAPKKPRKTKQYVPTFRSGSYAIIVALSSIPENGPEGMSKLELIDKAQPYCNSSFTAMEPGKFYTAWTSMTTLVSKELVYERGRPTKRYALTEEGRDVAKRIKQVNANNIVDTEERTNDAANNSTGTRSQLASLAFADDVEERASNFAVQERSDIATVVPDGPLVSDNSSLPKFTAIRLTPGSFTVHLVLDVREIRAKTDRDYMQEELKKKGIRPLMRSLELGDAQWVAKCHDPEVLRRGGDGCDEVVLDYIVERKRLDDLIGSIKDGRFREQKFRLKRSGVRHVTYIVEEISLDREHFSKYEESVQTAIASTQVVNGFTVKKTQKMDDTIRYLARMTELLKKRYESQPLRVIPSTVITVNNYLPLLKNLRETQTGTDYYITYQVFSSLASKSGSLTLRDLFLKMLMCTRGITGEKAMQIQKIWKTPNEFVKAYGQCGGGEAGKKRKQELVSSRSGNHAVRSLQIGKALSTKVAEVWAEL